MAAYRGVTFAETRPVPGANDLARVEDRLGFALPSSLRGFLGAVDGGRPDKTGVLLPNGDELEVAVFLPVVHELYPGGTLEDTYERVVLGRRLLAPELLPCALGGGGDFWCIDRRSGAVVFHAMDYDESVGSADTTVAPTLDRFFELLRTPAEMGW